MILYLASLLILIASHLFSAVFRHHDDFNAFDGKPVVALWRGTYFSRTHFPNQESQSNYMAAHGLQVPIYCAAAHRQIGISYTQEITPQIMSDLNKSVAHLHTLFKSMEARGPITIDRHTFSSHRHAFQHIYSNSTNFIAALSEPELPTTYRKYKPVLEGLPQGNCELSFSLDVVHGGKYGYGLKDYGHIDALGNLYDDQGHRQHTYIGYLQGIFMTDALAKQSMPYNVVAHHHAGHVTISSHYSNNILSEQEVSFVGTIPGKAVVITSPLKIPDLSGPYPGEYREEFGLTKRKYDNIRGVVTDQQTSAEHKNERIRRMLNEIIQPARVDDRLVYRHTIRYKAQEVLSHIFDGLNSHVEGIIGLDGRVHNKAQYA